MMTLENILERPLRAKNQNLTVHQLKIISFTHKTIPLQDLSTFYINENDRAVRLSILKDALLLDELFYLATCNRIEFIFTSNQDGDVDFQRLFFKKFNSRWSKEEIDFAVQHAKVYAGDAALHHLLSVASSLDSLVVGEREIITQVRKSYDECHVAGLTGDFIRLLMQSTIATAKQVFTDTKIATHPVSVVSLAYRKLRDLNVNLDSRILMIGSGETNTNLSKYLVKHGFRNFTIFNRTEANAQKLVDSFRSDKIQATAHALNGLENYSGGFDILITCTAASDALITNDLYTRLLDGDTSRKVIIDLAIPADVEKAVVEKNNVHLIDIGELKSEAAKNLAERHHELKAAEIIIGENMIEFHRLLRMRELEVAMQEVPGKIREIKTRAINDVFAKEMAALDEDSRELIGKMLDYMEKKCISVPMKIAKEIILEKN